MNVLFSAPGPQCPQRCTGACTVTLGDRSVLPCDKCSLSVQPVNTTWFKSPGDVFVSSSDDLVFGKTLDARAGQYTRSQYIQHVGRECVTGVYSLNVEHYFCEFVSVF